MRKFPLVRILFLCSNCVQCTSWPILLPVQWACVYICTVYVCVCVCFFHLCKCLCSNHGSGCVSWRRRKASFEVGPVKWAPGSCAWSWPAKITEKEIIIYTEVNVFDLFTRIYLVWQTNYCDLANNSYNTTKLCIFPFSEGLLRNKMKMFEMLREWIDSNLLPLAGMFDGTTVDRTVTRQVYFISFRDKCLLTEIPENL